jgi:hypothetical protein
MTEFALRRLYSRPEISDAIDGGVQDFLPHRDGKVVCACLSVELNPDAPHVILVGNGPDVSRWGEVFARQREFVPVFIKRAANAWQYVGRFRVEAQSTAADDLSRWESVSNRPGALTRVLYLEAEAR